MAIALPIRITGANAFLEECDPNRDFADEFLPAIRFIGGFGFDEVVGFFEEVQALFRSFVGVRAAMHPGINGQCHIHQRPASYDDEGDPFVPAHQPPWKSNTSEATYSNQKATKSFGTMPG